MCQSITEGVNMSEMHIHINCYHFTLAQVVVDDDNSKEWTMYDAGPKTVKCPLICFPPASGTGDVFFKQILGLTSAGYRVIAVSYSPRPKPSFWSQSELLWNDLPFSTGATYSDFVCLQVTAQNSLFLCPLLLTLPVVSGLPQVNLCVHVCVLAGGWGGGDV